MHNTIERSVILATGSRIDTNDFPLELRMKLTGDSGPGKEARVGAMVTLQDLEDEHISRILESCPNLNEAAEILGINQATLYRKRVKLGLKSKSKEEEEPVSPTEKAAD